MTGKILPLGRSTKHSTPAPNIAPHEEMAEENYIIIGLLKLQGKVSGTSVIMKRE